MDKAYVQHWTYRNWHGDEVYFYIYCIIIEYKMDIFSFMTLMFRSRLGAETSNPVPERGAAIHHVGLLLAINVARNKHASVR